MRTFTMPEKRCKNCGQLKPLDDFFRCSNTLDKHGGWCKECDLRRRREHREAHIEHEQFVAHQRYLRYKPGINVYNRRRHHERKRQLIEHYSNGLNICACCGENNINFLTIDHVNGGGGEHRRKINARGSKFYEWLIRQGKPKGYQVLCFNCNIAKGFYGECPHKKMVLR